MRCMLLLVGIVSWSAAELARAAGETAVLLPGAIVSRIPLEKGAERALICYPPGNSPFAAVQGYVWDVRSGRKTSEFTVPFGVDVGKLAVSPDGRYLAYELGASGSGSAKIKRIQVLDCRTGELVCDCTTAGGPSGYLQFAGRTRVVACAENKAVVCDVERRQIVLEFPIHAYALVGTVAATSPQGGYLAVSEGLDILVYDLRSGRPVAKMTEPAARNPGFTPVHGLAFSPDARELAAVVASQVVVWSHTGAVVRQLDLPPGERRNTCRLDWLLDGSGWLIDGCVLFDRASGRPLWTIRSPNRFRDQHIRHSTHLIDQNHVTLLLEHSPDFAELITTSIPWTRIREAKAAGGTGESLPLETNMGP